MQRSTGWTLTTAGGAVVALLSLGVVAGATALAGTATAGEVVGRSPVDHDRRLADPAAVPVPVTATTAPRAPTPTYALDLQPRTVAPAPAGSPWRVHPWLAPTMALPDPAAAPELELGQEDPAVAVLQRRLAELGYRPGPAEGTFGSATWSAVLAFQKAEGLERLGWVDAATWARLASPQAWRPTQSTRYPRVEVDLSRQVVLVVLGPEHVVTLNTSTGGGYSYPDEYGNWWVAHTPTGVYDVYSAVDGWVRAPLGTLYRPLYYDGGYAIHGSPFVPSYPDSHGCVRLSNDDMDWVFELAPDRMQVAVFETMDPAVFHPGTGARGAPARPAPPSPAVIPA